LFCVKGGTSRLTHSPKSKTRVCGGAWRQFVDDPNPNSKTSDSKTPPVEELAKHLFYTVFSIHLVETLT
jgi:hypothetical protein